MSFLSFGDIFLIFGIKRKYLIIFAGFQFDSRSVATWILAGPPPSNGNKITTTLKFSKQFKMKFNKSKYSTTCLSYNFKHFNDFKHVKMCSMHDFGISSYDKLFAAFVIVFGCSSILDHNIRDHHIPPVSEDPWRCEIYLLILSS